MSPMALSPLPRSCPRAPRLAVTPFPHGFLLPQSLPHSLPCSDQGQERFAGKPGITEPCCPAGRALPSIHGLGLRAPAQGP